MNRKSLLIFGIAAAMIAGTGGFLGYVQKHQKLSKPGVKVIAEPMYGIHGQLVGSNSIYLPERVANFTSKAMPIDDKIIDWLPKDTTYGQRFYEGPDGFQAQMAVVLMGTDRTSLHRPQWCLPAQGWVIEQEEQKMIPVTQPYPYLLPVMMLKARQEGQLPDGRTVKRSGVYVYWFVSAEQLTAQNNEYMVSILKHLLWKGELQRWAYVTCFSACAPGQEERVYQHAQELIAGAVPHFQLVTGPRGTKEGGKSAKELAESMKRTEASQ